MAKIGGQPIFQHTQVTQTKRRERETEGKRESLVTLPFRDLLLPRGAEGKDLLTTMLNRRDGKKAGREKRQDVLVGVGFVWMDSVPVWHRACRACSLRAVAAATCFQAEAKALHACRV